jgi:hypothetical protein
LLFERETKIMGDSEDRDEVRRLPSLPGGPNEIAGIGLIDPDQDDAASIPESSVPSASNSLRGGFVSLSDPFQDDEFAVETVPNRLHRRSASVPVFGRLLRHDSSADAQSAGPPDRSLSAETYFQRLLAELKLAPSSTTLVSDNAVLHASAWKESVLLPSLDAYHPMDDYMVYILRRERIHARNVILVSDNPRTHMSHERFRSLTTINDEDATESSVALEGEEEPSESSLNVESIAEYFTRKVQDGARQQGELSERSTGSMEHGGFPSIARLPAVKKRLNDSGRGLKTSLLFDTARETFPSDSYESQKIAKLPIKEESPNSVMDVLESGVVASSSDRSDKKKSIRDIDTELLGLKTEEDL